MTTIQPEGEQIRKALKWIAGELKDAPEKSRMKLVGEAGLKFNLSPNEEEYLVKLTKPEKNTKY
ncbi:MAG: hypothetical protein JRH03_05320 [Deltaproteobacteria bacterium]|nr:hypothetical protein [Deltaproteobacteria bacterium]